MKEIMQYTPEELSVLLGQIGEPKFRAKQVFSWLSKGADFDEMTNIPKKTTEKLKEEFIVTKAATEVIQRSADGTEKYLFSFNDGQKVECVLMRYKHGNSACISTQAGCRMGCAFCASTKGGLIRNLSAAEMLAEVIAIQRESGERVDSLVLMGTGEPLDNYDNTLKFISILTDPGGINLGMRHISLSTCGLIPKIDELSFQKLQLTLSVSLHAPNNIKRDKIMPVNKTYPVEELISCCRRYFKRTGRRIYFEYAMIRDFNDSEKDAEELSALLRGMDAHVNLIPLNEVKESEFKPSTRQSTERFVEILEKHGITATVRRKLGTDIDAACGQLRAKSSEQKSDTSNRKDNE